MKIHKREKEDGAKGSERARPLFRVGKALDWDGIVPRILDLIAHSFLVFVIAVFSRHWQIQREKFPPPILLLIVFVH